MLRMTNLQKIKLRKEPNLAYKFNAFTFQSEAVQAIKDLEYGAIFHEQGLGKTKIAIDLMIYWLQNKLVDTVLFIVKKNLVNNWQNEFKEHTYLKPKVLSQNKLNNYYVFNSPSRVIITHYEVFKSDFRRFELFLHSRNVAVILDESTKIKNPESKLTQALQRLSPLFKKRIIMTGTPIPNRPYDLWAQIYFLDNGKSLGTDFISFKLKHDLSNDMYLSEEKKIEFEENIKKIYPKISKFTVRETKGSGIIKLPQKIIQNIITGWESNQEELYEQYRKELKAIIVDNGVPLEDNAEEILKRLLRLIQLSSNPNIIDQNYRFLPGKFPYLLDIIEQCQEKKEKCIIWSSFIKNVDWLNSQLKHLGSVKIHGEIPLKQRNNVISSFLKDNEVKILISTPGVAKEGLTLTIANNVIFFDRMYSLDDYLQAQDRIHRISQIKTCFVYNLIMENSIDEWIDQLLKCKHLSAQLVQNDISNNEFKKNISYDFGYIIKKILNIDE